MIKPKKIPKGFLWDPVHEELIDVRCNNPKLRKLCRESVRVDVKLKKEEGNMIPTPAICISPFYTVGKKRPNRIPFQHYPHIPILTTSARVKRGLLGKRLFWTIKEDGENVTVWLRIKPHCRKSTETIISSHNQEIAAPDITGKVMATPEFPKVMEVLKDNPTYRVVVEECRKGMSVTRVKIYPRAILYVVDIFDTKTMNFLTYTQVFQICKHYDLPVVELFGETRHKTIRDLNAYCKHILEHCEAVKEEGMVVKTFNEDNEYIQGKVKVDIPEPKERKIREGPPQLPQIPVNEIMGAISHVEADFGLTGEPKHDMPLVARAVSEECKKHLYSSRGNLFTFYQEYMANRKT